MKIAVQAFWGLLTVFIILGGILGGVFTPTESAAVACIYAFVITMFVYRDYKWSELHLLVGRVVRTVGIVMIMIGFSVAFGYMMAILQVPGWRRISSSPSPTTNTRCSSSSTCSCSCSAPSWTSRRCS